MFRKDNHILNTLVVAALLALAGLTSRADAQRLNGTMQIDTAISISYAPAGGAPKTATSNTASVVLAQTAGVLLSPVLGSQQVAHATPSLYPVTVRNSGSVTDTYALSIVRTVGWGVTLLNADHTPAPARVTLAAGASQTFLLDLTPPASATHACSGMAVLKAVSGVSPAVYGQAAALTNCTGV